MFEFKIKSKEKRHCPRYVGRFYVGIIWECSCNSMWEEEGSIITIFSTTCTEHKNPDPNPRGGKR